VPRGLHPWSARAATFIVALTAACTEGEREPPVSVLGPVALERVPLAGDPPVGRFPRIAPYLATAGAADVLVAWTKGDASGATLMVASPGTSGPGEPTWGAHEIVTEGAGWFVNWADCPAVAYGPAGARIATWLVRSGESPYAYDITFAISPGSGQPESGQSAWSEPSVLHDDRSEAEHGFVSLVPLAAGDAGWCAVWLDGRNTGGGHGQHDAAGAMTLVTRCIQLDGTLGPETTLDDRVCDCCPTDAARLADGSVVVVYRDRGEDELRDIGIVRGRPEDPSSWSSPRLVHPDGWIMPGCPVNGPAVAASGERVGVAWFTLGTSGRPRVLAALSEDGGATFGAPFEIDEGDPLGRVDAAFVPVAGARDEVLVVTWLELTGDEAEWCARTVSASATDALGPVLVVAEAAPGRESGAMRIARSGAGAWAVWTDAVSKPGRVLAARLGPVSR